MFSIVIPLYNKEKQIAKTLESVFNQTFQEYEIVIVNDGSTDNSVEIVKQIDDKRIKLINQPNSGVSSARNTGIKNSSFEYVAFLDADDEWDEEYLQNMNDSIIQFPNINIFSARYNVKKKQNNLIDIIVKGIDLRKNLILIENYFEIAIQSDPIITSSSVVIKKNVFDNLEFPLNIKAGEDLITWSKICTNNSLVFINKVLVCFNKNDNQNIRIPDKNDYVGDELEKLYRQTNNKSIYKYKLFWHKIRFTNFIRLGMKKEAKIEFDKIKNNLPSFKVFIFNFMFVLPKNLILSIYSLNNLIRKLRG